MNNLFGRILLSLLLILAISGFFINANAQVGTNNLFCPAVPFTEGMLNLEITALGPEPANFSGGMIGTLQKIDGKVSGGLDWTTTHGVSSAVTVAPTNEIGSQLLSWWSRTDNRNTKIQISNISGNAGPHTSEGLNIHVNVFSSDCIEILDFCDNFRPLDTNIYDLSNLETNSHLNIPTSGLADKEGIIVFTTVDECPGVSGTGNAIEHNSLSGNVYISDSLGYSYGSNMYARQAVCIPPSCTGILTGSRNARLDTVLPDEIFGLFNSVSPSPGSDAVVMNLHDNYGPPYIPTAPTSSYSVSIYDNNENAISCGDIEACFLRLGINSSLPARQDLGPPFTGP